MADIEQRLREFGREGFPVALEAADTIATLRQEAEALRGQVEALRGLLAEAHRWISGTPGTVGDYATGGLRRRIEAALTPAQQKPKP